MQVEESLAACSCYMPGFGLSVLVGLQGTLRLGFRVSLIF